MKLTLRTDSIEPDGCFSTLIHEARNVCYTVEPTDKDLKTIIPAGVFSCKKTLFQRGNYLTFEVTGIPNHDRLLFHKGNTEDDSRGCILVGLSLGKLNGKKAVFDSKGGFVKFWQLVSAVDEFTLEVTGRGEELQMIAERPTRKTTA